MRATIRIAAREFFARLGSVLIWVGIWDILIQFVAEENYAGNVILILAGLILWFVTGELTQGSQKIVHTAVDSSDESVV